MAFDWTHETCSKAPPDKPNVKGNRFRLDEFFSSSVRIIIEENQTPGAVQGDLVAELSQDHFFVPLPLVIYSAHSSTLAATQLPNFVCSFV